MTHLIAGMILVLLGAWGIIAWWSDFGEVLRGLVPLFLVLVGLAAIGASFQKRMHEAEHESESLDERSTGPLVHPEED